MKRLFTAAVLAASTVLAGTGAAQAQATLNVMVMQEDWDRDSLSRNSRIQRAVLTEFNQALHAPAYRSQMSRHGIDGMDVYDETSLTLDFYGQDRTRRTDQELVSLARTVQTPGLDVMVPFTLYAQAVTDPYTGVQKLQMSMNYRALTVRDGRYLGGDNIDIDTAGVPFRGCASGHATAADPHCVKEFVSQHGERLARTAGNKLALQLAALMGTTAAAPQPALAVVSASPAPAVVTPINTGDGCRNIPATYQITFRGFEPRQVNAIEDNISFWNCVMATNVSDHGFSEITFTYKTRADEQRILRNIRLMSEVLGVVTEAQMRGPNGIVVEALALREN